MDHSLGYFLAASALITIAPGPDNIYLLTKSLSDGAKSGIVLTCGLASGIVFHTGLVIVGVAALVQNSPMLFAMLKYIGAAYLLFLAAKAWQEKGALQLAAAEGRTKLWQLYRRGILMNVLNPKVLLFFLAFLPQFVDMNAAYSVSGRIALLGVLFAAQVVVIFSAIAVGAGKIRPIVIKNKNIKGIMGKVQSVVLLIIALSLVFGA